jgi:hypothetical protein
MVHTKQTPGDQPLHFLPGWELKEEKPKNRPSSCPHKEWAVLWLTLFTSLDWISNENGGYKPE